jgi:hypothetical protein
MQENYKTNYYGNSNVENYAKNVAVRIAMASGVNEFDDANLETNLKDKNIAQIKWKDDTYRSVNKSAVKKEVNTSNIETEYNNVTEKIQDEEVKFTSDPETIKTHDKTKEFRELSEKEQKKWLFTEHVRLQELDKTLEDERNLIDIQKHMLERQQSKNMLLKQQLENQKKLYDQKWQILEKQNRQLTVDKERFEREKLVFKDKVYREARKTMVNADGVKIFFKGVHDLETLKKRYKSLAKIYHPDNMSGDKDILLAINTEYERLLRFYLDA